MSLTFRNKEKSQTMESIIIRYVNSYSSADLQVLIQSLIYSNDRLKQRVEMVEIENRLLRKQVCELEVSIKHLQQALVISNQDIAVLNGQEFTQ